MSQFSKFVRPGYKRIDAKIDSNATSLKLTAYAGNNQAVLVIINPSASVVSDIAVSIANPIADAKIYKTSLTANRESTSLTAVANKLSLSAEAKSISTIVINYK